MSQPRSGLSVGSVSLLGYLEEHPEVSEKLYKLISKIRKEQSSQLPTNHTTECYLRYFEECRQIVSPWNKQK